MNPEFDSILEQPGQRLTTTRIELYHRIQQMLVTDAVEIFGQSEFSGSTWTEQAWRLCVLTDHGLHIQPLYPVA